VKIEFISNLSRGTWGFHTASVPGRGGTALAERIRARIALRFPKGTGRLVTYRCNNFAPVGAFAKGWKRNQG
jgi:hypothetical protein